MKKIGLIILFISLVVTVSSSVNQQKVYRLPALAEEVNYDENCDSNNINILDSLYNSKDSIGREKERAKKEQEILLIKEEITKQNEYLEREKMIFFQVF